MKYNFDEIIDRRNNHSAKFCELEKKFGTEDVIPLWIADMDFRTAAPIVEALKNKAEHAIFGYTSRPSSYNEAFCMWQQKRNGYLPNTELIGFSVGVVPSIIYFVKHFTKPNESILIQPPVYGEFQSSIADWGRKVVNNPLKLVNGRYEIDFEDFEKKITGENVKMFILCNPHNPVGRVWTPEELLKLGKICLKHDVLVLSDEIHSDLILKGKHTVFTSVDKEFEKITISLFSATKTFNLAGLQASFIVFNTKETKNMYDDYWGRMDIHRNSAFSVVGIEAAFRHGEEWLEQLLEYLHGNVQFITDYCKNNIPQIKPNDPECTYLLWLNCKELGLDDKELNEFMVKKAKLGMNSGISFGSGGEGFMRLNFACPRSVLEKAMKNLEAAVKSL